MSKRSAVVINRERNTEMADIGASSGSVGFADPELDRTTSDNRHYLIDAVSHRNFVSFLGASGIGNWSIVAMGQSTKSLAR